jgi:hypothetical protein
VAAPHDGKEVAAMTPMPRLLKKLGFMANERTRRAPCLLHEGSNPTAFSWRDDGRWHCFVCGQGGDRIALVRAVRQCSFREAVMFLAALAGVVYQPGKLSRAEIEGRKQRRERADRVAWQIRDDVLRLRASHTDKLHRAERLWRRLGEDLLRARSDIERDSIWNRMARFAPACTFFLSAFHYINYADSATLISLALASPAQRRAAILGDDNANATFRAA